MLARKRRFLTLLILSIGAAACVGLLPLAWTHKLAFTAEVWGKFAGFVAFSLLEILPLVILGGIIGIALQKRVQA